VTDGRAKTPARPSPFNSWTALELSGKKVVTTIDPDGSDNAAGHTEKVRDYVKKKL